MVFWTADTVSDGSDGHTHVFFTQPTDASGQTSDQTGNSTAVNASFTGRLFARTDATATVQLDASERTDCAGDLTCGGDNIPDPAPARSSAPSKFLDASADGTRAYFTSIAALTDDAPEVGAQNLYMFDTTKPASAPDNLTFLSPDAEPADGSTVDVQGVIGASRDEKFATSTSSQPGSSWLGSRSSVRASVSTFGTTVP